MAHNFSYSKNFSHSHNFSPGQCGNPQSQDLTVTIATLQYHTALDIHLSRSISAVINTYRNLPPAARISVKASLLLLL